MHEDLIGYLLGALEPHEMQRIEELLKSDPDARRQLEQVERSLRPLDGAEDLPELPPPDLVSRTMAQLPTMPTPDHGAGHDDGKRRGHRLDQPNEFEADYMEGSLPKMKPSLHRPRGKLLTFLDVAGFSAAAAVLLALLLPSIASDRFEARRTACQDQLRELGTSVIQFANRSQQSRLPVVAESGPEAFAGIYTVRLKEAGLLEDDSIRWCPSLDAPGNSDYRFAELNELPTIDDIRGAALEQLRRFQQFAGGHYAYNLGVMDGGQLSPSRFEARSSFAVLSDAAMAGTPTELNYRDRIGHDGRGINVLFEDGQVRYLSVSTLDSIPDHPLFNHRGDVEAGVNVDDAALAPSWRPPLIQYRQR
ncbi:MAG: hypothetical protein AAF664_25475 [Planctomycetota bacterium]